MPDEHAGSPSQTAAAAAPEKPETNFMALAPQLLVGDVAASVDYYRETLGFDTGPLEYEEGTGISYMALMRRDGFYLQLRRARAERGVSNRTYERDACDLYFVVRNLDALYEEFSTKAAKILVAPRPMPYPMREFEIEDCNGYVLTFGQPLSRPRDSREGDPS
jgi:uncharacterized glyoxalase superfamily protein PhnB